MTKDIVYDEKDKDQKLYFIDSIKPYDNEYFFMRLLNQETDFWGNGGSYVLVSNELVHRDLVSSYRTEDFLQNINGSDDGLYDGLFISLGNKEHLHFLRNKRFLFRENYRIKDEKDSGIKLKEENWTSEIHKGINDISTTKNHYPILYCIKTGQGDMSMFISSEDRVYLIDTNILPVVSSYRLNTLKSILGNRPIEALIITHRHLDHYRGAYFLFGDPRFRIKNLIVSSSFVTKGNPISINNLLNLVLGYFKQNGGNIISPVTNCSLKDGETTLDFFPFSGAKNENDNTLLLQITYKDTLYYLTGDMGSNILGNQNLSSGNTDRVVLKVSHHGSITGTSQPFLAKFSAFSQKDAFISFGQNNRYGHPDSGCCSLLSQNGFVVEKSAQMNSPYKKY